MEDTESKQAWLNEPQQARSRETMNRFVQAAERLLREKSFDEITIGEIVEGAERTVGSFYARFDDKWALLRTVIHRYLEQIRDFMDDLLNEDEWAAYPVGEMVTVTSRAAVGLYRAHGHIFRAGLAFSATDDVARRALVSHYAYMRQRIGRAVLEHPDVTVTPDVVKRVDLAIEASGAILDTRLLFSWRDATADWDVVAEEIEVLFLRVSALG